MSQTSDYYKWDWIKPELEIYQRFEKMPLVASASFKASSQVVLSPWPWSLEERRARRTAKLKKQPQIRRRCAEIRASGLSTEDKEAALAHAEGRGQFHDTPPPPKF